MALKRKIFASCVRVNNNNQWHYSPDGRRTYLFKLLRERHVNFKNLENTSKEKSE
jgi:hypothetical protein